MSIGWKKTPNAKPTITVTLDEELLKKIEDYQFENRIKNRSRAIQQLIIKGMECLGKKEGREE
ncbi:ribbon-helix-helix domain-containing protein [Geobacillus phage vB_GthS_NIIg9.7]|nr:ribbon-helix-helix domain-containing protein [Geobacillus phage vB_GthS_NIIg9.7]